jgi:hypothetical protein
MSAGQNDDWLEILDEEDLNFLKRFVLLSGSLKELAQAYNVSYPTVRLRLDRLIQKIKISENNKNQDRFEILLRAQFADGKLDGAAFKQLLGAYQQQKKGLE